MKNNIIQNFRMSLLINTLRGQGVVRSIADALIYTTGTDIMAPELLTLKTPLMIACEKEFLSTFEALLSKDVSVISIDNEGRTVFSYACQKPVIYLRTLIDYLEPIKTDIPEYKPVIDEQNRQIKLCINSPSNDGFTPLMESIMNCQIECTKLLLKYGCLVNIEDDCGNTALTYACRGSSDYLELLLPYARSLDETPDLHGYSLLMHAIDYGRVDCINVLLRYGCNINYMNHCGNVAIHIAGNLSRIECIKILLENGADVNVQNKYTGDTPLMYASMNGNKEMIGYLLENGADVYKLNSNGENALNIAFINRRHTDIVNMLLRHGIDVNNINKKISGF